ncbi:hypothetical protein A3Q56_01980 [Intoshia linei]|uniref:RING-type domain-containing protein n=1 Tax=Intoshia linei TaxID=1819745 RepID=A0A177B9Z6_9BILA|nr:hypothetical protein A3Q56_01980 [Intoshia linei]
MMLKRLNELNDSSHNLSSITLNNINTRSNVIFVNQNKNHSHRNNMYQIGTQGIQSSSTLIPTEDLYPVSTFTDLNNTSSETIEQYFNLDGSLENFKGIISSLNLNELSIYLCELISHVSEYGQLIFDYKTIINAKIAKLFKIPWSAKKNFLYTDMIICVQPTYLVFKLKHSSWSTVKIQLGQLKSISICGKNLKIGIKVNNEKHFFNLIAKNRFILNLTYKTITEYHCFYQSSHITIEIKNCILPGRSALSRKIKSLKLGLRTIASFSAVEKFYKYENYKEKYEYTFDINKTESQVARARTRYLYDKNTCNDLTSSLQDIETDSTSSDVSIHSNDSTNINNSQIIKIGNHYVLQISVPDKSSYTTKKNLKTRYLIEKKHKKINILKEKMKKFDIKKNELCLFCCEKNIEVVFNNCGHYVSCSLCAINFKECPVCRKNIKSTLFVYKMFV